MTTDELVETAPRVALLARQGAACDRLLVALRDAGAEVVLVSDPAQTDVASVRQAGARALLIALEPAVEEALDQFDALLADPSITVIFDEADLAAQREGWDAARWSRHLAAKLNRHEQVLPPGAEIDAALAASVPPPELYHRPDSDGVVDAFAAEADLLVLEVPRDSLAYDDAPPAFDAAVDLDPTTTFDPVAHLDAMPAFDPVPHLDDVPTFDPVAHLDAVPTFAPENLDAVPTFDPVAHLDAMPGFEPVAHLEAAPTFEPGTHLDAVPTFDPVGHLDAIPSFDPVAPLEAAPRPTEPAAHAGASMFDPVLAELDTSEPSVSAGLGQLLLEPMAEATGDDVDTHHRFRRDLDDLELRISDMQLEDARLPRSAPQGAVVVLAGLGGPDAVRQLLGELPAGFPRPVLIQQRLEGGRHDKLVRQMQRATTMPVALAEPGLAVDTGHVYMLPAELGLVSGTDGLQFKAVGDAGVAEALFSQLPASDSAVVLLSGSDPASVDAAMNHAVHGALVAGQSADGCFDAVAASALVARGADVGTPAQLAKKLAARWPSADAVRGTH